MYCFEAGTCDGLAAGWRGVPVVELRDSEGVEAAEQVMGGNLPKADMKAWFCSLHTCIKFEE